MKIIAMVDYKMPEGGRIRKAIGRISPQERLCGLYEHIERVKANINASEVLQVILDIEE